MFLKVKFIQFCKVLTTDQKQSTLVDICGFNIAWQWNNPQSQRIYFPYLLFKLLCYIKFNSKEALMSN